MKRKNKFSILLAMACVATMAVGVTAYFTDREVADTLGIGFTDEMKKTGKDAIDVEITPGDIPAIPDPDPTKPVIPIDPDHKNKYNEEDIDEKPWGGTDTDANGSIDLEGWKGYIMVPSEKLPLDATISNTGLFALDTREVITVESKGLDFDLADPQWKIYKGNTPLTLSTADSTVRKLVYKVEGKTIQPDADYATDYDLVFESDCDNKWQQNGLTVKYDVYAKQHDATSNDDWATVASIVSTVNN